MRLGHRGRADDAWCRSRDSNPDAAAATGDFKSPASTSSATPARVQYMTGAGGRSADGERAAARSAAGESDCSAGQADGPSAPVTTSQAANTKIGAAIGVADRQATQQHVGPPGTDDVRWRHATGPEGAGQPEEIRATKARPSTRADPGAPGQRGCSDPSARASAAPSRRSASLTRTASRPNARQASPAMRAPARITSSRPGWMPGSRPRSALVSAAKRADGRVDLGERQDVPLDEPPVVLGHAELVGHQRGVRAGDADRAADRGAELRRHGVRDGGGDVAREGRDLRRLRRIVVEEALGEPHHADVEAAHERRRLAGGADGELRAAAADVDEQERVRGGGRRVARDEPRGAAAEGERALLLPGQDPPRQAEVVLEGLEELPAVPGVAQDAGGDEQAPRGAVGLDARRVPGEAGVRPAPRRPRAACRSRRRPGRAARRW